MATVRPVLNMDTTSTEHDFRFPRRPTGRDYQHMFRMTGDSDHENENESGIRLSMRELNAGLNGAYASASRALVGPAQFPLTGHGNDNNDDNDGYDGFPRGLQQNEPAASQLFKMLGQYKQQIPNQRRMENLAWRLMGLEMRWREGEAQSQKYDSLTIQCPSFPIACYLG